MGATASKQPRAADTAPDATIAELYEAAKEAEYGGQKDLSSTRRLDSAHTSGEQERGSSWEDAGETSVCSGDTAMGHHGHGRTHEGIIGVKGKEAGIATFPLHKLHTSRRALSHEDSAQHSGASYALPPFSLDDGSRRPSSSSSPMGGRGRASCESEACRAEGLEPSSSSISSGSRLSSTVAQTRSLRPSTCSQLSERTAGVASQRSSFAADRTSLELITEAGHRLSLSEPSGMREIESSMLGPGCLQEYSALGVIPPDVPVPMTMLQKLWGLPNLGLAERTVNQLVALGALRSAVLQDGSAWCAVSADHARFIAQRFGPKLPAFHAALLRAYTDGGAVPLTQIQDDGFILQHIAHLLMGAGAAGDLLQLLSDPGWLELKMTIYGVSSVVADFRLYLHQRPEDGTAKLLLQALQLSLGACSHHWGQSMLRQQMASRLMTVAALPASSLKGWHAAQEALCALHAAAAAANRQCVHLLPRSPTLQQAGGLQRMTLRGHSGPVVKALINPDGQHVLTISQDGSARVWDMDVGDCVLQVAQGEPLTAAAITPNGKLFAVATDSGQCCVFDAATGALVHALEGHTGRINSLSIDAQGIRLVTVSNDRTARCYSVATGLCECVLTNGADPAADLDLAGEVLDVAISRDGCLAATVSEDFTCHIWDLDEQEHIQTLRGHTGWVVCVQFFGQEAYKVITASSDSTARVWNAYTGACLHVLSGHRGRLNRVSVDASGTKAVTAADDVTARVWDLATGACLCVLAGHSGWITDAAITSDGSRVVTVSGDHQGMVWDAASGGCELVLTGHGGEINCVVLTMKGRFAVTAGQDGTSRVYDLQACSNQTEARHEGGVRDLQALPGGRLVSVGEAGSVVVWEAAGGRYHSSLRSHTASITHLRVLPQQGALVTGSADRKVCVWACADGSLLRQLPEQQGSRVKSLCVDGAARTVAMLLFDSSLDIYDLLSGECVTHLIKRGTAVKTKEHVGGINAVALTRDGSTAITVSKDSTARMWSAATGACTALLQGHSDGITSMALSPNEALLATASYDGTVRLWHLAAAAGATRAIQILPLKSSVCRLAFSPDSTQLACVTEQHTVYLYDVVRSRATAKLAGHKGAVNDVCFSPDGSMLATCSADCSLRAWCCDSGKELALFIADSALTCCTFSTPASASASADGVNGADGDGCSPQPLLADCLAAGDASGNVHICDFPAELVRCAAQ